MLRQGITHQNQFLSIFQYIDSINWLILLLFAPLFMMIKPSQSWLLLLIPILWFIAKFSKRQPIPQTPMNLVLLVILLQVLISLYATYDIAVSLQKISGVIWGIAVFFALIRLSNNRKGLILTTLVFIAGSTGIIILGFLGIDWPTNKIIIFNQVFESFPTILNAIPGLQDGFHPNEVGGALTWIIPFLVAIFIWMIIGFKKIKQFTSPLLVIVFFIFILSLLFSGSLVLIFSQSRSAYIGVAIGLVLMVLVALPKKARYFYAGLLFLGGLFLLYLILNGHFMLIVNQIFPDSGTASMAFSTNTLNGRIEIWARGIYAVQDFAFTGMGMNTFRTIVNVLYPLQTISADVPIKDIGHAHNLFLQTALDLGIPGLIAFVGMYILSFWMLSHNLKRLKYPTRQTNFGWVFTKELYYVICLGLLGGQIAHVIYGMTDAIAFGAKPGILFWVMQSMICGIYFKVRQHDYH